MLRLVPVVVGHYALAAKFPLPVGAIMPMDTQSLSLAKIGVGCYFFSLVQLIIYVVKYFHCPKAWNL